MNASCFIRRPGFGRGLLLSVGLALGLSLASVPAQTLSPLAVHGPPATRLNLVVMSEGYTASELSTFLVDATNMVSTLLSRSPYSEYSNYFNVYTLEVASNESGSSHPDWP